MTAEEYVENWDRLNDADKRSLLKDFRAAMAEARAQALEDAAVAALGAMCQPSCIDHACCAGSRISATAILKIRKFAGGAT